MKLNFKIPKVNIPYEKIGSVLVGAAAVIGSVVLAFKYPNVSASVEPWEDPDNVTYSAGYTKGDAIAAISNSQMSSWDKTAAIKSVAEIDDIISGHSDVYYSIEKIARSTMNSWDKASTIKSLAEGC